MTPRRPGRRPGGSPRRGRRDSLTDTGAQRALGRAGIESTSGVRPRATGRMAILLIVAALLVVSFASSLNAFFHQRANINELNAQIEEREAKIKSLEQEQDRWEDPGYLQQQARERFNYQLPGEKTFIVLDENGEPLDSSVELDDPASDVDSVPTTWWETAWGSMELAGNPPRSKSEAGGRASGASE
jgi:cell division protein FtsB